MKKKTKTRKLQLHRETLRPLQNDQLEPVAGGVRPSHPVICTSLCTSVSCP